MIRKINKKDFSNLFEFFSNLNIEYDLKKTIDNIQKKGKIGYLAEENAIILGAFFIADKEKTKELHIFSPNRKIADGLLRVLMWNHNVELYTEINKDDKTGFVLKKYHFRIIEKRDKSYLMHYNPNEKGNRYGSSNNRKYNNNNSRTNKRFTTV